MKKQFCAILLSATSVFALNVVAPNALWIAGHDLNFNIGRNPAASEAKTLVEAFNKNISDPKDKAPYKIDESKKKTFKETFGIKEADKNLEARKPEERSENKSDDKKIVLDQGSSCNKENREADLEAKIEKLMEDKNAILVQLEELKELKKKKEHKDELTKIAPEAPATNHDIFEMMNQMTSLLKSQQDQQQMLMNQMYSMFNYRSINAPMNSFMGPYALDVSGFEFQMGQYAVPGINSNGVGIGLASPSFFQPQNNMMFGIQQIQNQAAMSPYSIQQSVQSQMFPQQQSFQGIYQDNGFNFGNDVSMNSLSPMDNNSFFAPAIFRTQI